MWNFIKKKLGYHVCEEFTQWTAIETVRSPELYENYSCANVIIEKRQERKCTICGKIESKFISKTSINPSYKYEPRKRS